MENSSYSKTRSPARFLAAFLAFVMVLIVMPVLPVGAAYTAVTTVYFMNQPADISSYDPNTVKAIFTDPTNSGSAVFMLPTSWGSNGKKVTVSKEESVQSESDLTTFKMTAESNNLAGQWESFSFGASIGSECEIVWSNNNSKWTVLLPNASGIYEIPNTAPDRTTVYIKWREKTSHTISYDLSSGVTVKTPKTGETYTSRVSDELASSSEDYNFSVKITRLGLEPVVTINGVDAAWESSSQPDAGTYDYKINSGFSTDQHIVIETQAKKLNVNVARPGGTRHFKTSLDTAFGGGTSITRTVNYGSSFSFTIEADPGYSLPKVTVDGQEVTPVNNSYTIDDITTDKNINIEDGEQQKYTVQYHFPAGVKVEIDGVDKTSVSNEDLTYGVHNISITLEEGYSDSSSTIRAAIGGVAFTLRLDDGKYTGTFNVSGASSLEVSGVSINTYQVIVAVSDKYTASSTQSSSVNHGSSYQFTLNLREGYKKTDGFAVKFGDETLDKGKYNVVSVGSENSGIYTITINDIVKSGTVTFEGIEEIKCTVTNANENDHYTIGDLAEAPISYNGSVTFTVTPKAGYRVSSVYYTDTQGGGRTSIPELGGSYSISNITKNLTVHVTVECVKYKITYRVTSSTTVGGKTPIDNKVDMSYNVEDGTGVCTAVENGVKVDISKVNVERKGWKVDRWSQNGESLGAEFTNQVYSGTDDVSIDLTAKWTVDLKSDVANSGFFYVSLGFVQTPEKTKFNVGIHTNIAEEEKDSTSGLVRVLAHGVFYSKTEEGLNTFLGKSEDEKISAVQGADERKFADVSGNGQQVFCYKYNDGAENRETILADGAFYLSVKGDSGKAGAGWVLVSIDGKNYLFVSKVETGVQE